MGWGRWNVSEAEKAGAEAALQSACHTLLRSGNEAQSDGSEVNARVVRHSESTRSEQPADVQEWHEQRRINKATKLSNFRQKLLKRVKEREQLRKAEQTENESQLSAQQSAKQSALANLHSSARSARSFSTKRPLSKRKHRSSTGAEHRQKTHDHGNTVFASPNVSASKQRRKRKHAARKHSSMNRITASDELPRAIWQHGEQKEHHQLDTQHAPTTTSPSKASTSSKAATMSTTLRTEKSELTQESNAGDSGAKVTPPHSPHDAKSKASSPQKLSSAKSPKQRERLAQARFAALSDKLQEQSISLPALCSCAHSMNTDALDLSYPTKCAKNCQLRDNNEQYMRILSHVLHAHGFELP